MDVHYPVSADLGLIFYMNIFYFSESTRLALVTSCIHVFPSVCVTSQKRCRPLFLCLSQHSLYIVIAIADAQMLDYHRSLCIVIAPADAHEL